jgi:hypothetical protein
MRLTLCAFTTLLAAACYPAPTQTVTGRCPVYEGQRLVTSRMRMATGEIACVYAPEEKRR